MGLGAGDVGDGPHDGCPPSRTHRAHRPDATGWFDRLGLETPDRADDGNVGLDVDVALSGPHGALHGTGLTLGDGALGCRTGRSRDGSTSS